MSQKNRNTDADETVAFRIKKNTDGLDTGKIDVRQVRNQANYNSSNYYGTPNEDDDIYRGGTFQPVNYPQNYGNPSANAMGSYPNPSQNYGAYGQVPQQPIYGQQPYTPVGQAPQQPIYGQQAYSSTYRQPMQNPNVYQRTTRQAPQSQPVRFQTADGDGKPIREKRTTAPPPPPTRTAPPRATQERRKPKKNPFMSFIRWLCIIVIVVFILYSAVALYGILRMNHVDASERECITGSLAESYVKNILVIGTDSRDPDEDSGRSDSMILLSMNSHTNEIYMTSIMRDTYVEIPGNGSGKLNAAYSYGGPELLMDTIEYNFDVHITDYVLITFEACADVIDAVGGVEVTVSDREAQAVNDILISEVNEIMGDDREDDLLDGGGTLKLDGKQALSYSRIRYVGNADFERTERQRTVLNQIISKIKKNPLRAFAVLASAVPEMSTDMSVGSMYLYSITTPFKLITYSMEQQRIPDDTMFRDSTVGGESVLVVDFDLAKQKFEDTVFAS